jgi:tyrosyl-tRNA synthetase
MGLLVSSELCKTRSEARRAVEQGGVAVNGEKVQDIRTVYTLEDIAKEEFILRRGKKNYRKIIVEA